MWKEIRFDLEGGLQFKKSVIIIEALRSMCREDLIKSHFIIVLIVLLSFNLGYK